MIRTSTRLTSGIHPAFVGGVCCFWGKARFSKRFYATVHIMAKFRTKKRRVIYIVWRDASVELDQAPADSELKVCTIHTVGYQMNKKPKKDGYYTIGRDLLRKDARSRITIPIENVISLVELQTAV